MLNLKVVYHLFRKFKHYDLFCTFITINKIHFTMKLLTMTTIMFSKRSKDIDPI